MSEVLNSFSLTNIAASLAEAMGIERPEKASASIAQLTNLVRGNTSSGHADRIFMYNPDAVAMWLYQKYTSLFDDVLRNTQLTVPLCSVMPSVTPVCFGSFYTGAFPETHGITRYEKPVIKIDTLFDAAIRAGKRVALVVDDECSIGKIFCEREMDYFYCSWPGDDYKVIDAINAKAMELIEADQHDIIVVYNGDYDYTMHRCGTEAERSMSRLRYDVSAFSTFADAIRKNWSHHDTLIGFAMDHGCHDIDGGCGSHGLDMPEDLNIMHFYGVIPKK